MESLEAKKLITLKGLGLMLWGICPLFLGIYILPLYQREIFILDSFMAIWLIIFVRITSTHTINEFALISVLIIFIFSSAMFLRLENVFFGLKIIAGIIELSSFLTFSYFYFEQGKMDKRKNMKILASVLLLFGMGLGIGALLNVK